MLKTDFLAYISPQRYWSHTCSSLFIEAIALLILFIIFLLSNSGTPEPTPSSQSVLLGSSFFFFSLGNTRQLFLPEKEKPIPLFIKADGNLSAAKIYAGINTAKIKTQGSL